MWILCLAFTGFLPEACSQSVVFNGGSYHVIVEVHAVELVPLTNPCTWGYNYKVLIHYEVTFTGTNPPANMYTLQGTLKCNDGTNFFDLPNGPSSGSVQTANGWRGTADCGTATAASIGCNTVKIQIEGPYLPHNEAEIDLSHSPTLPITLVGFEAEEQAGLVRLAWSTASEQDNDYFTVERSADAQHFTPVLHMQGAGNSEHLLRYTAVDHDPLAGTSYYRLRQTDLDGQSSLSRVVPVHSVPTGSFKVFPNPAPSSLIHVPPGNAGRVLQVFSMQGALVHQQIIDGTTIHLPELGSGTYLLVQADPVTGQAEQCGRWVRQ